MTNAQPTRKAQSPVQEPRGITAAPTVMEGGNLLIRASSDVRQIQLLVPSVGRVVLPVVGGRAEYQLPPSVRGGTRIVVSDMKHPNASSIGIDVVGGSSR